MLAVLSENLACGRNPGGPSVAKATAAARHQAKSLRTIVMRLGIARFRSADIPQTANRSAMPLWLMPCLMLNYSGSRTPRPCMKRSLICTGSRRVVPTPGLSSMRTPISVGPAVDMRLVDQALEILLVGRPGAVGKAAGDGDGDDVGHRGGRRRLRAGDLVDAVVHHDHGEILRRQRRDRRQRRPSASAASRRPRARRRGASAAPARRRARSGRRGPCCRACRNSAGDGRRPTGRNWCCRCRRSRLPRASASRPAAR